MKKLIPFGIVLAATLPVATTLSAKVDKKQIKAALEGTLYVRIDAPCATGRHVYGTYKRPLVEVSPDGANTTDTDTVMTASWWHADSTYWGIRINDPVVLDEFEVDGDDAEVEIELEGVGPADGNSTVIEFVNIHSFDDFQAAFDQTFSKVPLQDEHDDWTPEIKQAISERRLTNGMTKRQVFYITGTPKSFEKKEEGGMEVEIWHLRQDKGMKLGYFKAKLGESTGLPATVRFEDGQLVDAVQTGTSSTFELDDD